MAYNPLSQDPMSTGLKNASDSGVELFETFVNDLNVYLAKHNHDKLWYQPDGSVRWPRRWFWMFNHNSDKRDYITRLNFISQNAIRIEFSYFGARRPREVQFIPPDVVDRLVYKGSPPHIRIDTLDEVSENIPVIGDHFIAISEHIEAGGKLVTRGWSHIEVALAGFLRQQDSPRWTSWNKPDFLGIREIDLMLEDEKIAIEVQGDYWHSLPGAKEKDELKRKDILANGWSLIWAWESGIREKFPRVIDALERIRAGERFVEINRK